MPPTSGSFSIDVFTRVVIVVSSIVSPIVLPQPIVASGAARITASIAVFQQPSFFIPASVTPGRRCPRPSDGCNLHARDVESRVDHQDFACDSARRVAQQKRGGIADLAGVDVTAKWCALAIHVENARESADPHRGNGLDGTG